MLEAFNALLQEQMPNTTLELTQVTYNDFSERWQLAAASRDPFDIGWMGWTLSLGFEVANGSVMPLDDLINNYAPVLWDIMPAWAYDVNRVAGKLYAIPNNQLLVDPPSGAYMPKELADKYMDKAAFERAAKAWFDSDRVTPPAEFLDVIEDYLQKCKDGGDIRLGISQGDAFKYLGFANTWFQLELDTGPKAAFTKAYDESNVVYSVFDLFGEELELYKRFADWYQRGFIRKDALTIDSWGTDLQLVTQGSGYVMWFHNYDKYAEEMTSATYGVPITILPFGYSKAPTSPTTSGFFIPSASQNPERTIEFLGLLNSAAGKDLYNMLVFGLEGDHYVFTGPDTIETLHYVGNPRPEHPYGQHAWAMGNTYYAYETQADTPGYNRYMIDEFNVNAKPMLLSGLSFDQENVQFEVSQWQAIVKEYEQGLIAGTYNNPEATLRERNGRLDNMGVRNLAIELQRQINDFLRG